MARAVEARIEAQHGPNCTCTRLEPISFQPVIAGDSCPGEPTRYGIVPFGYPIQPSGRVVLTFPHAEPGKSVPAWLITIHDADTGEQIVDTTCLRMVIGDNEGWETGPLEVELTRLIGLDGMPIGAGSTPVPTDAYREHMQREREQQTDLPFDGPKFLTGRFRYLVVGPPVFDRVATSIGVERSAALTLRKGDEIVIRDLDGTELRRRITEVRGELPGDMEVETEPAAPNVPTLEQRHHAHAFPADDSEPPVPAGPCDCGMTYERYQRLAADEAAGIRYRNETAAPVDQYGHAVETPFA